MTAEEREELRAAIELQTRKALDWRRLEGLTPPVRDWMIGDGSAGWLSGDPTLVAGPGGIGKSLLMQAVGTALAMKHDYVGAIREPRRVLAWFCEDDEGELWRRQLAICEHFGLRLSDLEERFVVEPRRGRDNVLFDTVFGKPMWTPLHEELREQVNDYGADVLILDNIAHVFGAKEQERSPVTRFVSGLAGLVRGRPFAPMLLGHVARTQGSEFAGSAAWENACRMRWYLGTTLPDEKSENDGPETSDDLRYLARRKTNYSAKDYVRLRYRNGVLIPEEQSTVRFDPIAGQAALEDLVINGLRKLRAAGVLPTDGQTSPDYLPSRMVASGLAGGFSKRDLASTMNRLMADGKLRRAEVGKYSNRSPRFGLVET